MFHDIYTTEITFERGARFNNVIGTNNFTTFYTQLYEKFEIYTPRSNEINSYAANGIVRGRLQDNTIFYLHIAGIELTWNSSGILRTILLRGVGGTLNSPYERIPTVYALTNSGAQSITLLKAASSGGTTTETEQITSAAFDIAQVTF